MNNQGVVSITGGSKVGNVLTATVTDPDGIYAGRDGLFAGNTIGDTQYTWYVDNYQIKPPSTSNTFTLTAGLIGKKVGCMAHYQDMAGAEEYAFPTSLITVAA